MPDFNPYEPPKADLGAGNLSSPEDPRLAERSNRLGASFLDGIFSSVLYGLLWLLCYFGFHQNIFILASGAKGLIARLAMMGVGAIIYLMLNGYLLVHEGQTLGKFLCGIRIAKPDGSIPTLLDSYFKRTLLMNFLQLIPIVGPMFVLIDVLFIFRNNRKCLHDHVAGTLVVNV